MNHRAGITELQIEAARNWLSTMEFTKTLPNGDIVPKSFTEQDEMIYNGLKDLHILTEEQAVEYVEYIKTHREKKIEDVVHDLTILGIKTELCDEVYWGIKKAGNFDLKPVLDKHLSEEEIKAYAEYSGEIYLIDEFAQVEGL